MNTEKTAKATKKGANEVKIPLQMIVDLLPASVYWLNNKMEFLGCNIYQARMIGLKSPQDIIGTTIYDYNTKEMAEELLSNNYKVLKHKKTMTFEEDNITLDGKKEIYRSEKSPIFNESGKIIGLLGVSIDITDQKEREYSKDVVLEQIISTLPGHIYWKNREGVYLGCNENLAKMINLASSKKIIGRTIHQIYPGMPEIALKVEQDDREVIEKNQDKYYEELGVDHNNNDAIYMTHKVPLHNASGKAWGMLGLSFDITARKKAEEALVIAKDDAERANKAKSEFMEFMTHELRTPLTGMLGTIHNLLKTPQKTIAESHQALKNIQLSGELLLSHINDILDYAKLRKGQFELYPSLFNLYEAIAATHQILTPNINQKKLKLSIDYPSDIPQQIYADRDRMSQILFNLIGNAVKFTQKGSVKTTVQCLSKSKHSAELKISVTDTGPGIPKDKFEAIFNKFEQIKHKSSESRQGTGLGLAIVRQLATKFGARIGLESKLGKGSTFHITLTVPLKEPARSKTRPEELPPVHRKTSKNQRRVLLVEDNIINQTVIEEMLKDLNCETKTASNGKEALNLFDDEEFDLIFLDINLPDIDGYTVAHKMREKNPDRPILALTANTSDNCIQQCKNTGIKSVIGKPVRPDELEKAVKVWLG